MTSYIITLLYAGYTDNTGHTVDVVHEKSTVSSVLFY